MRLWHRRLETSAWTTSSGSVYVKAANIVYFQILVECYVMFSEYLPILADEMGAKGVEFGIAFAMHIVLALAITSCCTALVHALINRFIYPGKMKEC